MNNDEKYSLYERSVQNPETDIEFINQKFADIRSQKPLTLREDFGGTGHFCCEWVKQGPQHLASVIDLNPEPLGYGKKHHRSKLEKNQRKQVHYRQMNVLDPATMKTDLVVAFNFSYFIFKQRRELLAYFTQVRNSLKPEGVFFLDCFGGSECYAPIEEETQHDGFKYFWDLDSINPINNHVIYHIHFKKKGKAKYKKAFSYDWRMWSLPEIRDILEEAGFQHTLVYWEGDSEDGDEGGNDEFDACEHTEQCESWVVYLAAYN